MENIDIKTGLGEFSGKSAVFEAMKLAIKDTSLSKEEIFKASKFYTKLILSTNGHSDIIEGLDEGLRHIKDESNFLFDLECKDEVEVDSAKVVVVVLSGDTF